MGLMEQWNLRNDNNRCLTIIKYYVSRNMETLKFWKS